MENKKFKIIIQETVVDIFEIEAKSEDHALEIVKKLYYNCEIVLEPGEIISSEVCINNRWFEL